MSYGATTRAGTGNAVGAAGTASSVLPRSQPEPRGADRYESLLGSELTRNR